ncbi:MAG: ATP synthase F1 subunit epsilon [Bacteroidia bacterium]|nr:ATP synthase F1 subunit epsilon [Bacteroidia bacterium]
MKLFIISPEKVLFDGEAESVILPGKEGSLGVLNHHAPYIVLLKDGNVEFQDNSNQKQSIYIKGGIAEINENKLTILTD